MLIFIILRTPDSVIISNNATNTSIPIITIKLFSRILSIKKYPITNDSRYTNKSIHLGTIKIGFLDIFLNANLKYPEIELYTKIPPIIEFHYHYMVIYVFCLYFLIIYT
ncbi:protein of unknown function [Tepidibacter aestuarii]|nr:protein of unknown function [Tepidibacter aestuarii]